MIHFKVSAPGKVILYGEHAVVYGKTAIAGSLDLRTTLIFSELPTHQDVIKISFAKVNLFVNLSLNNLKTYFECFENSETELKHEQLYCRVHEFVKTIGYSSQQQKLSLEAFVYMLMNVALQEKINIKPCEIELNTELTIGAGLGSSASFAVCLAACLIHWSNLQKNIEKAFDSEDLKNISTYAFNCEKIMHGSPSGIDNSVCTYGSIVEFRKNEPLKPIPNVKSMKILLVNTRVQRSTKTLLERVISLKTDYPGVINPALDAIDYIAREALEALKRIRDLPDNDNVTLSKEYDKLMTLMNMNQGLLATCQVSHSSLDNICAEAKNYGFAAKLTGAGGGGYAYILLTPETERETIVKITKKLMTDGYPVSLSNVGCAGVQIHE